MIKFFIGFAVGAFAGIAVMALAATAAEADRQMGIKIEYGTEPKTEDGEDSDNTEE